MEETRKNEALAKPLISPQDPISSALGAPQLAPDLKEQLQKSISIQTASWRAPLPPPSILEQYDKIEKGFADRIMQMAEKQMDHRHEIENISVNKPFEIQRLGQIFAFILSLLGLGISALGIIYNDPWVASLTGAAGLTLLASVFLTGRYPKSPKIEEINKRLKKPKKKKSKKK